MRKLIVALVCFGALGFAKPIQADQVSVNIAYPLNGGGYVISPEYPILPISFSVTCKDLEDHEVKWGYGEDSGSGKLGEAKFRGTIGMHFLQKFSEGVWVVWVSSDCGKNEVKFKVGESR